MVRKSSKIVRLLAVLFGILFIVGGIVGLVLLSYSDLLIWISTGVAILGCLCIWWPLTTRQVPPLRPVLAWTIRIFGGIYLVTVVGFFVSSTVNAEQWEAFPSIWLSHIIPTALFLHWPRLFVSWLVGFILAFPVLSALFCLLVPAWWYTGGAQGFLLWLAFLAPIVGPLMGLPLASFWLRRANRRCGVQAGSSS